MCFYSLSSWFWPDQWPATREAASRFTDSQYLYETWLWRTYRMERSGWEGPLEGLSSMEKKVFTFVFNWFKNVALSSHFSLTLSPHLKRLFGLILDFLSFFSFQPRTFFVWALWIQPMARVTPCMSTTSTASSSGSTAYALPWPNNRGRHPELTRLKPSKPSVAPAVSHPHSMRRKLTRTVHLSLAPNSGLRHSPKPDWIRSFRAHWRGRKRECRRFAWVRMYKGF